MFRAGVMGCHTQALLRYGSGDDEICLTLSSALRRSSFYFFFPQHKLALVEGRDCIGKDVKRICLVAHQSFQQSIRFKGAERKSAHPLFFCWSCNASQRTRTELLSEPLWSRISFFFILASSGWKQIADRGACVCVCVTHQLWLVLFWSPLPLPFPFVVPPANRSFNSH